MTSAAPILALMLVAGLAGCTDSAPPLPSEWKGRDLREPGWTNTTLQPEWTLVLEYPLSSGATLDWDWLTLNERPVYFQVVKSEGKQATKMVARHMDQDKGQLSAPTSGVYQVIWMNDGFLEQNFTWKAREGYAQRLYPPNEGPGCLTMARGMPCLSIPDGSE